MPRREEAFFTKSSLETGRVVRLLSLTYCLESADFYMASQNIT